MSKWFLSFLPPPSYQLNPPPGETVSGVMKELQKSLLDIAINVVFRTLQPERGTAHARHPAIIYQFFKIVFSLTPEERLFPIDTTPHELA